MNFCALKRNTEIHRALAESFKASFVRCFQRPLTEVENATVESAPLCFTFMRLEIIGLDLDREDNIEDASEIYKFIASEVSAARDELLRSYAQQAAAAGLSPAISSEESLLVLEERLLACVQRNAAGD